MNPTRASASLRIDDGNDGLLEAPPESFRSTEAVLLPGGRLPTFRRSANNFQPGVGLSAGARIVAPIAILAGD